MVSEADLAPGRVDIAAACHVGLDLGEERLGLFGELLEREIGLRREILQRLRQHLVLQRPLVRRAEEVVADE